MKAPYASVSLTIITDDNEDVIDSIDFNIDGLDDGMDIKVDGKKFRFDLDTVIELRDFLVFALDHLDN